MYDNYDKRDDIDINIQLLQGKTDEELEEICIALLGDIQQRYPKDLYSSYFSKALSNDTSLHDLATRIEEDREHRRTGWERPKVSEDEMRRLEHDFGFSAVHAKPTQLLSLARSAITSEIKAIAGTRILRNGDVSKEEFDRRIRLLTTFCDRKVLEDFVKYSIPYGYYSSSVEEIEQSFVDWNGNNRKVSALKTDLPNFLRLIDSLLDAGIDLSTIEMQQGFTALDAYQIIKDRFGEYIQGSEIVEPESVQEDIVSADKAHDIVTNDDSNDHTSDAISSMLEENESKLSLQEIQNKIEANNRQILEIMAENQRLVALLVEQQELQQSSEKSI